LAHAARPELHAFPTRRSSDLDDAMNAAKRMQERISADAELEHDNGRVAIRIGCHFGPVVQEHRDIFGSAVHTANRMTSQAKARRSEEHTSELQSRENLVCRLL